MRIDIHSHLMNVAFLEQLAGRDILPTAVRDEDGFVVHCAPGLSLPYRAPILDAGAKLADMDAAGIDLAVLSHGLPGPHMLGGAQADGWAARINDDLAAVTAAHPGRFAAWASLGFGDTARTIAEADRCLDQLGLAGFQVWSNLGDRPLDDPGVLPVLEHIADRDAAIHLHPAPPPGQHGLPPATMLGFAFPADTSLAVLRLIGAGLFDRDPVIIAAHLGGVLPWLRERISLWDHATASLPGQPQPARPAGEYLGRLYVDTVGYGPAPLEYCYTQLGAGRLLFGTDHPYAEPSIPQDLVDHLPCTQAERQQILAGNAQRLLGLNAAVAELRAEGVRARALRADQAPGRDGQPAGGLREASYDGLAAGGSSMAGPRHPAHLRDHGGSTDAEPGARRSKPDYPRKERYPMTVRFTPRDAARLRERLAGRVVLPGQEEYDAARRVWNASHDHRPALIVQPLRVADVRAAVRFARDEGLPVSVRGGGHNHAGYAVADGALMLDLSALVSVHVDPARRVATVGGGATWGVVDQATQAAGLAVTGADVSPVGVGGATLGGGVGWLHRMYGLSCDNLLAAEVVTASAGVLHVSAQEHPELFWALRGGGGNFGVVTSFTFALHPVGPAHVGTVMCPMERAAAALALYQHLCDTSGDELFLRAMLVTAPSAPFIPEELRGRPVMILSTAWFGPAAQGESALRELREFGPPAASLLRPLPYMQLQRMQDAVPRRVRAASFGGFTGPLTAGVIEALTSAAAQPPPMSMVELQPLGGAVARINPDATAFRYRRAAHLLAVLAAAPPEDPGTERAAWAEKVSASLPAGTIVGPSVHSMGRDEPEDHVLAAYGDTAYARLAAVKAAYDPDNMFRFNQNIRPQPHPSRSSSTAQR